ncbi:MAG: alpha/beta hydrolase [Phycisphaerae bacterium]|nr:alpha/beta hydrolase [Phycisphaerae bacterium]HCD34693.1 alpha/beta hydrolase [Phycisphaerales bacterium]
MTFQDAHADEMVSADAKISFTKSLEKYQYPYKVHRYPFESQGQHLEMAYMYLSSDESSKGTITLLHGKNFNGAYWQVTANFLHAAGYNVLIPDQIGFGKSSKPTEYQYSFEALAHNTKTLLDHLDIESSHIIGHSMGGMLASRFALLYPNKTQRLTLVNPIGLENYLHYVEYKDVDFFYKNELKQQPQKIVNYQKKNYYDGAWNDQYAALTIPLIGWVNGPDWSTLAMVSARTYDMIFTGPVIEEFDDFKMPATLIIGTRDRTGPGRNWKKTGVNYELGRYDLLGAQVKKRNPNMNVIELDGLGHLPHIEHFERFQKALKQTLLN